MFIIIAVFINTDKAHAQIKLAARTVNSLNGHETVEQWRIIEITLRSS